MKVVHVIGALSRQFGGPPTAVLGLANAAVTSDSWEPVILTTDIGLDAESKRSLDDAPAEIFAADGRIRTRLQLTASLLWRIRTESQTATAVVLHGGTAPLTYVSILVICITIRKSRRPRIFIQAHGALEPYEVRQWSRLRKIYLTLIRSISSVWATFIVTSNAEACGLQKTIPRSRFVVLSMGVADGRIDAVSLATPHERLKAGLLVQVGRVASKKRIDISIRALQSLRRSGLNLRLAVIGDGEQNLIHDLHDLARECAVQNEVDWYGSLPAYEVDKILAQAVALVLPSENENFAHVVIEAVAAGVPCLVSQHVGLSEWVGVADVGSIIEALDGESVARATRDLLTGDRYLVVCQNVLRAREDVRWSARIKQWAAVLAPVDIRGE